MRRFCVSLAFALASCTAAHAELLIGRLGSTSNAIAAPSTLATAQGFDLYVTKVNDAGGINGQRLRVVFRDDQFKPDLVVQQAHALIEKDDVLAIVSPQGTPGTVAILKDGVLTRDNVAIVGAFTGASEVLTGENIFPLRSTYEDEVAALARQMQNLNQKRIAYLYYNTSQGPLFAPVFSRIIKANGLEDVGAVGFDIVADPAKQESLVNDAVGKIAALHPDAVFVFAVGPTFPMTAKALESGLGPMVGRYTFSINNWESLVKQIGVNEASGMVFSQAVPYPYGADRKIVLEYQHDLHHYAPDAKANFAGLEGYMTAKVLVEALRRAGPNPTSKKVLDALEALGRYDLGDYIINYSKVQHRVEPSVDVTLINRNGSLIK